MDVHLLNACLLIPDDVNLVIEISTILLKLVTNLECSSLKNDSISLENYAEGSRLYNVLILSV